MVSGVRYAGTKSAGDVSPSVKMAATTRAAATRAAAGRVPGATKARLRHGTPRGRSGAQVPSRSRRRRPYRPAPRTRRGTIPKHPHGPRRQRPPPRERHCPPASVALCPTPPRTAIETSAGGRSPRRRGQARPPEPERHAGLTPTHPPAPGTPARPRAVRRDPAARTRRRPRRSPPRRRAETPRPSPRWPGSDRPSCRRH